MNAYIRGQRPCLVGLALLAAITSGTNTRAQSVTEGETVRSVRRMLERLPYYRVFDFMAFGVHRGTVTLVGYSYEGRHREFIGEERCPPSSPQPQTIRPFCHQRPLPRPAADS